MGIERTHKLVVGWELMTDIIDAAGDDILYDSDDYFIQCSAYDAMNLLFGKVITECDGRTGFEMVIVDPNDLIMPDEEIERMKAKFRELTDGEELLEWVYEGDEEPKAMLVTRFQ
jgi:hypothetical protein